MALTDMLPLPDWGLRCPKCRAALAGAPSHMCPQCRTPFDLRQLLSRRRPIPDLGLTCSECEYTLTGLTGSHCPECGKEFDVWELLDTEDPSDEALDQPGMDVPTDHHATQRAPVFTGRERPLPDFGLFCGECESPLAGAEADACPACGCPFDLFGDIDEAAWLPIRAFVPPNVADAGRSILYAADVPYVLYNTSVIPNFFRPVSRDLMVPREFYFDALHALAETAGPAGEQIQEAWVCPECDQDVPAGFALCWSCGRPHPDVTATQEAGLPDRPDKEEAR